MRGRLVLRRSWVRSPGLLQRLILNFSMVILSLLLIQEGQLSVSGERMAKVLVNCLEK